MHSVAEHNSMGVGYMDEDGGQNDSQRSSVPSPDKIVTSTDTAIVTIKPSI